MKVYWEMSIGNVLAKKTGIVNIDDDSLAGLSEEEKQDLIDQAIWDEAVQHVVVSETKREC